MKMTELLPRQYTKHLKFYKCTPDFPPFDKGGKSILTFSLLWIPGQCKPSKKDLPYFFGYKTELFSFQNNPKDLDPSYKTDLDLWDCLGRVNWYYSKFS